MVDRLVLALFNNRELDQADFCSGPRGGMRLKADPLKVFLVAYEEALTSTLTLRNGTAAPVRRFLVGQVERLRRLCIREEVYRPFVWTYG